MNVLKTYYYISAQYLKECLPYIPELKITNAKTYYGKIYVSNGKYIIALSKWNLDCGRIEWWDNEDFDLLIETICHEFAHMFFWNHGEDHSRLTEDFKTLVKLSLEKHYLENQLQQMYEEDMKKVI